MSRAALCVLFAFSALPLSALAAGVSAVGNWSGALHRGDAAYRVRFHVQATPDGRLTGTVSGLPGDDYTPVPAAVEASGDTLKIAVGGGRYSGVWDQAEGAWVGSWKQADVSEPLALRWDTDESAPRLAKPIVVPALPTLPPQTAAPPDRWGPSAR
jgi:hypothetical protein